MKFFRKLLTVFIVLTMVCVGVLFALQNKAPVPLDVLVYTFEAQSLALWVLGAFALGGLLGMIVSSVILVRMRASLGSSKRQLDKVRAEVSTLRSESPATEAT
jgi:putative membrane protein